LPAIIPDNGVFGEPELGEKAMMKPFTLTATCLAATFVLAACTGSQQRSAQDQVQQAASSAPDVAKNALLVATVGTRLAGVDVDSATSVHISAKDGVVTLSGQAHSAGERERYESVAKSTDGVSSVRDLLTVNPKLRSIREQTSDAALTARVAAAIAAQAGVNVFHVTPTAKSGTVTLRGKVPSASIARTIVDTVKNVPGVTRVDDTLIY
jgi:osmotically-inducible protein OsmY